MVILIFMFQMISFPMTCLYINQGDGTFRNEIRKYMSYQTKSSMGNDMADVNNDGNPDMFTLDMMPDALL